MRTYRWIVLGLVLLGCTEARAQEAAALSGAPPVLVINREEIKPGQMGPHEKGAATFVSVLNRAHTSEYRLGLVPVSGDDNQVLYLEGYPSFAQLETAQKELDHALLTNAALRADFEGVQRKGADEHNSQRTMLARFRADLSYRPLTLDQVAHTRFVSMQTVRTKLGRTADYVDYLKATNEARQKAGVSDVNFAVYQVVSGAPAGVLIIFSGYRGLDDLDALYGGADERDRKVNEALGGAEVMKQRRMLISEILQDVNVTLFAMNPVISRPSPPIMAANPDFWTVKPAAAAPAKALASKKEKKP